MMDNLIRAGDGSYYLITDSLPDAGKHPRHRQLLCLHDAAAAACEMPPTTPTTPTPA